MRSGSSDPVQPSGDGPRGPVGPGRVVLIVGPSGSGKDTLLRLLAARSHGLPGLVFPKRVVTRLASADENNLAMSAVEFDRLAARGGLALTWEAHGLRYGVPVAIDDAVTSGATVLVNASRSVLGAAKVRFTHVATVLVDAPIDVLARRLAGRGREDSDDIGRRLDRNPAGFSRADADLVIINDGPPEAGVAALLRFLATPYPAAGLGDFTKPR